MAGDDDIDYSALAHRLSNPDEKSDARQVLYGKEAAAYGRAFLAREYGSEESVEEAMRPGRPVVGSDKHGPSPTVRARVSRQDFAELMELREQTGRTEADLIREGVHLLLARYKRAS